jgi:RNA polymerase sigma-70 factor (ECF subfamily)
MPQDGPGQEIDISQLTGLMVKGDEIAYRTFYDHYFNRLLRYLLVVTGGRDEAAREVIQQTMLRVVRHIRVFNSEPTFWSWLTVLARSSVVDEERKRTRYLAFLDRFFIRQQVENDPGDRDPDYRLHELLQRNLELLPSDERDLIERKYLQTGSVKEIACTLQSSEKAIESRLVRIRKKLRAAILEQLRDEP